MRFFAKLVFFIPGAAIGFILSSAIAQVDESAAVALTALGVTVGGSLTTALGTLMVLRAHGEAERSGGLIRTVIKLLLLGIVIVAAILALARVGVIGTR